MTMSTGVFIFVCVFVGCFPGGLVRVFVVSKSIKRIVGVKAKMMIV